MAKLFLKLIFAGRKTFEEVPEIYQAEVKNLILKKVAEGDLTAQKYFEKIFKQEMFILEFMDLNGARTFLNELRKEFSSKTDKVANATAGNIAALTADGKIADSGLKVASMEDFTTYLDTIFPAN